MFQIVKRVPQLEQPCGQLYIASKTISMRNIRKPLSVRWCVAFHAVDVIVNVLLVPGII